MGDELAAGGTVSRIGCRLILGVVLMCYGCGEPEQRAPGERLEADSAARIGPYARAGDADEVPLSTDEDAASADFEPGAEGRWATFRGVVRALTIGEMDDTGEDTSFELVAEVPERTFRLTIQGPLPFTPADGDHVSFYGALLDTHRILVDGPSFERVDGTSIGIDYDEEESRANRRQQEVLVIPVEVEGSGTPLSICSSQGLKNTLLYTNFRLRFLSRSNYRLGFRVAPTIRIQNMYDRCSPRKWARAAEEKIARSGLVLRSGASATGRRFRHVIYIVPGCNNQFRSDRIAISDVVRIERWAGKRIVLTDFHSCDPGEYLRQIGASVGMLPAGVSHRICADEYDRQGPCYFGDLSDIMGTHWSIPGLATSYSAPNLADRGWVKPHSYYNSRDGSFSLTPLDNHSKNGTQIIRVDNISQYTSDTNSRGELDLYVSYRGFTGTLNFSNQVHIHRRIPNERTVLMAQLNPGQEYLDRTCGVRVRFTEEGAARARVELKHGDTRCPRRPIISRLRGLFARSGDERVMRYVVGWAHDVDLGRGPVKVYVFDKTGSYLASARADRSSFLVSEVAEGVGQAHNFWIELPRGVDRDQFPLKVVVPDYDSWGRVVTEGSQNYPRNPWSDQIARREGHSPLLWPVTVGIAVDLGYKGRRRNRR